MQTNPGLRTTESDRKPDAILVGYQKAGTTFLRSFFSQHPSVTWSRRASHFVFDQLYHDSTYQSHCEDSEAPCFIDVFEPATVGIIRLDNDKWRRHRFELGAVLDDCGILVDPALVAQRIKEKLPASKIIIVLRHQISWMKSHYKYYFGNLPRGRNSFSDFLSTPEGKTALSGGLFDRAVAAYQEYFGRQNVYVLLQEQVHDRQDETLAGLCDFLGIEGFDFDAGAALHNRSAADQEVLASRLLHQNGLNRLHFLSNVWAFRPLVRLAVKALSLTQTGASVIPEREERVLRAFYAASNARTARLTGLDLARYGYPL